MDILYLFVGLLPIVWASDSVLVKTKLGSFAGYTQSVEGRKLNVFKGIPFAKPPIGPLRFLDPVPISEPWSGVRNVSTYGNVCPGVGKSEDQNEDCLYLNIWSPSTESDSKPVMIYIHGGGFVTGSGSDKSVEVLASKGDVIVVSFNHRVTFFGFFYSEQTKGQGSNMGMKDQLTVLKWVHENIEHFGGNPDEVTIFGQSSGAIGIGMHLLIPASTPFFKKGIMMSGSPYSFLRPDTIHVATKKSLKLSQYLNCSSDTETDISEEAVKCLRSVSAERIRKYGSERPVHSLILPNPVYGDDFYPLRADKCIAKGLSNQNVTFKDVIIGLEKDEGESWVRRQTDWDIKHDFNITFKSVVEFNNFLYERKLSDREQRLLKNHYFRESDSEEELEDKVYQAYADLYVHCPSYFFAQAYSKQSSRDIFIYELDVKAYQPEIPYCIGVCHGEQLPYVFGLPFLEPEKYTDADRAMSERVIEYWSGFAKGQSMESFGWSVFKQNHEVFTSINEMRIENASEIFENCETFWRDIFSSH